MADLTNIRNYVLNLTKVDKSNSVVKVPVSFEAYGSLKRHYYDKNTKADIANEPKLMTAPYNNIVLTNGQFGGYETDLGYLKNTKYVNIAQGLDIYYKSKIWFDNYGLGDSEAKYHHAINESVDEVPLVSDAYNNYIQENKTQRTMAWASAGLNAAVGIATVAVPIAGVVAPAVKAGLASRAVMKGLRAHRPGREWIGQAVTAQKAQEKFNINWENYKGNTLSNIYGAQTALNSASGIGDLIAQKYDLKNTPDTVRSAGNNLLFDYVNNNIKLYTYQTRPEEFYLQRAWQYMLRFGYRADEFKVPDLKSRYYFNYIQTEGININANIPTEHAETLRAIFDNGTTIWHYRDDNQDPVIGDYSKENVEVSLNVQ